MPLHQQILDRCGVHGGAGVPLGQWQGKPRRWRASWTHSWTSEPETTEAAPAGAPTKYSRTSIRMPRRPPHGAIALSGSLADDGGGGCRLGDGLRHGRTSSEFVSISVVHWTTATGLTHERSQRAGSLSFTVARPCRFPTGFRLAVIDIAPTVPRVGCGAKTAPPGVIFLAPGGRSRVHSGSAVAEPSRVRPRPRSRPRGTGPRPGTRACPSYDRASAPPPACEPRGGGRT